MTEQIIASYSFTVSVEPPAMLALRSQRAGKFVAACQECGITVEEAKSPSRKAHLVRPRQAAMKWLRDNTDMSLPEIGRLFNRDHTTVIHAIRAVEKREGKQ